MATSTKSAQGFLTSEHGPIFKNDDGSSSNNEDSFSSHELTLPFFSDGFKVLQLITVSRHGTATQVGKPFMENEWLSYKILDKDIRDHELLTVLGAGQCWSIGRNLNRKYPDIINENVFHKEAAQFHIYPEQKTLKCAHFLEDGVRGLVTNIGYFSDSVVAEAFKKHGNCPLCDSEVAFPFNETQKQRLSGSSFGDLKGDEVHKIDDLFSDHSHNFLDWYDDCSGIHGIIQYKSCKGFTISDRKKLFIEPNSDVYTGAHTLYGASKHFYHELPNFGLSEFAVNTLKNQFWDFAIGDVAAFLEGTIMISYVHAFPLVKRIASQIHNGKSWIGYFVHNNNMAGLLVLLIGKDQENNHYYPFYASTVDLVVVENRQGEELVVLVKDNQKLKMKGCEVYCPIDEFKDILKAIIDEEDNAKAFCSNQRTIRIM